ncbi:MAG: hypothetical protein ABI895_02210 [Deltaproteobacteria bacterium]
MKQSRFFLLHSPLHSLLHRTLLSTAVGLAAFPSSAQEPAPAAEPPLAVAPPPAELSATPVPVPPPPIDPPKADLGPINIGVWGRVDVTLANGQNPKKLDDIGSTGLAEFHTSGKLHKYFAFTANLVASYGGGDGISGTAGLMDAIVQFEPDDLFHLWAGRNLVPVDRSNFSGPWFMGPWFYPLFGFVDGQIGPTVPHEGPSGRNDGLTAWGFYAEDSFSIKYYIGAYDLHDRAQSPLISGRLNLSLLSPEPGFYSNSTYYGKDLLAIGAGFQYKKNGSSNAWDPAQTLDTNQYTEFNADILFEKKLGESVLDLEGAFYKFNGDYERTDAAWFAVASLLLPGGNVQPLVRVQQAIPAYDREDTSTLVDAQLGYVLNAFATRFAGGFRYGKAGDLSSKTVFLGAQFEK